MKTKEEWREYHKAWRKKNRDKVSAANKAHYDKNQKALLQRAVDYRANNPDVIKQQAVRRTERYQNDPEFRAQVCEWGKESRGRRKEYIAEFERKRRAENPAKYQAYSAKYLADRANRTPPWANLKQIERVYELAGWASKYTDEPLEVDHIVPLRGENISGLHVPENLQILPRSLNRVKSNKYAS